MCIVSVPEPNVNKSRSPWLEGIWAGKLENLARLTCRIGLGGRRKQKS